MRYEFERDGTVVASVLWEGPGQVSVDAIDNSTRATVDRYLSSEVVYLGGGFDVGDEQVPDRVADAPARLDPVGVRARLSQPRAPAAGAGAPGRDRPRGAARGGRGMTIKGADAVLKALEQEGVEVIFGIPGGASMPIYDPLVDRSPIRHVLCRHEQGAGHAAEGYAWATGKVGVCMATSGPGATNLVTPLADAKMDSVPIVAITGQVPTPVVGNDAFQEADITGITMPVTKHNFLVKDVGDIVETIREAFHIARSGRPGPVLVDLPKDVLNADTDYVWPEKINLPGYKPTTKGNNRQVSEAVKLILAAERPVLYVGGGVIKANASEELMQLATIGKLPVVTTLMARGAFPDSHELCLGMPGMHGNYTAVTAMQRSDLLVALGARFDDRVTGKLGGLRARREDRARRRRPGRDRQEPVRRRADRR